MPLGIEFGRLSLGVVNMEDGPVLKAPTGGTGTVAAAAQVAATQAVTIASNTTVQLANATVVAAAKQDAADVAAQTATALAAQASTAAQQRAALAAQQAAADAQDRANRAQAAANALAEAKAKADAAALLAQQKAQAAAEAERATASEKLRQLTQRGGGQTTDISVVDQTQDPLEAARKTREKIFVIGGIGLATALGGWLLLRRK